MPDKPYAYGVGRTNLRVVVRTPAGAVHGGKVCFNDRYAWEDDDYAPLREQAPLWLYARDGELEYWAADLRLHPPRLRYRFGLESAEGTRWYGWDGLRDSADPNGAFEFAYVAEGDRPDSPAWAEGATFYQIFPDRFARSARGHRRAPVEKWDAPVGRRTFLGGDLDGIVEQLEHIASLSVDALYLTPIFSSPSNHKYDTADYFSVDPDFGGNAALRRLVEALHARGMRLVLDGVFNHAGAQWPPFVDVQRNGRASRHADWFYLAGENGAETRPAGLGYETWSVDVANLPKLRTSEPEVRELVCRIGRHWVQEYGIDGWRLDVANEVDHRLWRAFRMAVREVQPEAFLLGEIWSAALPWLRGEQLDSVMNYPYRTALLEYTAERRLDGRGFLDAIDAVRAAYPEPIHGFLYNLLSSHDAERALTACGTDRQRFGLASALLFALPGAVSIYYGDEVGMEGGDDPENRGGMVWDKSKQDQRLLALYRRLGRLRRELPALRRGRYSRLHETGHSVVFGRGEGEEMVLVAANAGDSPERISARRLEEWLDGQAMVRDRLAYANAQATLDGEELNLAPGTLALLSRAETPARGRR